MAVQKQHCVYVVGKLQRVVHHGALQIQKTTACKKSHTFLEKCKKREYLVTSKVKGRQNNQLAVGKGIWTFFSFFCYSVNYRSTSGMLILKRTTSKWVPLCATMPTSHGTKPTRYLCLEETSAFIVHALWTCYDPCCERQHICVTSDALMPHLHCEYFWSVTCGKPPFPIYERFYKRYLLFWCEWTPAPHKNLVVIPFAQ